jgi:hypothetical protein
MHLFLNIVAYLALTAVALPDEIVKPKGKPKAKHPKNNNAMESNGKGSNEFVLSHTYVTRNIIRGEREIIWQNGPLKVTLICGAQTYFYDDDNEDSVRLEILVLNEETEDIFVYYSTDDDDGSEVLSTGKYILSLYVHICTTISIKMTSYMLQFKMMLHLIMCDKRDINLFAVSH